MLNWFNISLQLNKFPIKKAQRVLREIQRIPEEDYEGYLQEKQQEILDYHINNNPFYRSFFGNRNPANWEEVPIMKKSDLQRPLNERLSKKFSPKNVYVGKTSGSSGEPFIFAKDRLCHALSWAEFNDRYNWYGIDLNKSIQARFYGIPLDRMGYLKERLKDRFGYRYRFPVFDLSEGKLDQFLKDFEEKRFDYINGYTSSIVLFAKYLQKKKVRLKDICPSLKLCIVTSEMFFEEDKELLEKQLGIPVINEYGASELGLLAFKNKKEEWVVNSETMYVEIVDEQGKVLPNGEEGRIVITSLRNLAHPFIRYDIGDSGILSSKSTFKKPVLEKLLGRTNDVALLPSGKVVPGLTFYYITKSIIEDDGQVKEFIVKQVTPSKFQINYVSEKELSSEEIAKIKAAMDTYLENGLEIELRHELSLSRNKRGKLKQFESLL